MAVDDQAGRFGPDLFRLDGMAALVTGARGMFGRVTAIGLARSGATVFATDKDAPNLARCSAASRWVGWAGRRRSSAPSCSWRPPPPPW